MDIGIPKEIKTLENRVAVTPFGVNELVKKGHTVYVEVDAGTGSGYSDKDYLNAGARMIDTPSELYHRSNLIVKVKEPLESEWPLIKAHHTLFTYFHFASSRLLTDAMLDSGATCIAYETVTSSDGSLPLLTPMSQVAGRLAGQLGAHYLLKPNLGKGKLIGGVPGTAPANVLILGGGIVGTEAARITAGMGANVTILDINASRLNWLANNLPSNVTTLFSSLENIKNQLERVDIIIGAVLVPGGKAPKLITRDMLSRMEPGTVLLDVAVDQGGCIETAEVTSHLEPVKLIEGIVHYGVPNMPGAVPVTSTAALASSTLPYIVSLANKGWTQACEDDEHLAAGLNVANGKIIHNQLRRDLKME